MNVDNKKTVLDDDSILYQKRDESFSKKDTSHLSAKGKAGYFKDYYMKPLIAIVLIAVFAIYMIYTIFFKKQESILSVAFLNEAYLAQTEELTNDMRDFYELTDDDQLLDISYYNLDDYNMQMKFTTLTAAQSLDVIVCPKETFEEYSKFGYFADLSAVLPEDLYAKVSDRILESSEVETDMEGNVTETLPAAPHGINISGNALYTDYEGYGDDVVIGIVSSTERTDNAVKFVDYLINYEAGDRKKAAAADQTEAS